METKILPVAFYNKSLWMHLLIRYTHFTFASKFYVDRKNTFDIYTNILITRTGRFIRFSIHLSSFINFIQIKQQFASALTDCSMVFSNIQYGKYSSCECEANYFIQKLELYYCVTWNTISIFMGYLYVKIQNT